MGQRATEEELSSLFARQLGFTNSQGAISAPGQDTASQIQDQPDQFPMIYSITQHYHHSAHLVPLLQSVISQAQGLGDGPMDDMTASVFLSRNGVDPSALFPSQITLFRQADVGQRMRLIELWRRNSSSGIGRQAYDLEFQQSSTPKVFQVEGSRSERPSQQQLQDADMMIINGGVEKDKMGNEMGMTDARANPDAAGTSSLAAEPYMASGYEHLAQRDYEQQASKQPGPTLSHFGLAVGQVPQTNDAATTFNHAMEPVYLHQRQHQDAQVTAWSGSAVSPGGLPSLAGIKEPAGQFGLPSTNQPNETAGAMDQADEEMML